MSAAASAAKDAVPDLAPLRGPSGQSYQKLAYQSLRGTARTLDLAFSIKGELPGVFQAPAAPQG